MDPRRLEAIDWLKSGNRLDESNRLDEKQALGYKNSKEEENFQGNRGLENGVRNNESLASFI